MITTIGILLLALSLSIHELGHAFAMRKHGIAMGEICLFGLGGKSIASFKVQKLFGDTLITIRPFIPIGAFVTPIGDVSALEKGKQVDVFAAGIANNLYLGFSILALTTEIRGEYGHSLILLFSLTAIFLLLRFAKAAFVVLLGLSMLGLVAYSLAKDLSSAGSIVLLVKMINEENSILGVVNLGAAVSISLGLFNCVPLFGLDGWKILDLYLSKRARPVIKFFAVIGIWAVLLISVGNDILLFFK